jgi:hypothetical protein
MSSCVAGTSFERRNRFDGRGESSSDMSAEQYGGEPGGTHRVDDSDRERLDRYGWEVSSASGGDLRINVCQLAQLIRDAGSCADMETGITCPLP